VQLALALGGDVVDNQHPWRDHVQPEHLQPETTTPDVNYHNPGTIE